MGKAEDIIRIELDKEIKRMQELKQELAIMKEEIKKKEKYLGIKNDRSDRITETQS